MEKSDWYSKDATRVLEELDSHSTQGLSEAEARLRAENFGTNELQREDRVSPFVLFLSQFKNTLIIILLAAIVLSFVIGEVLDAAIIGVIVIFSALLGFVQEYKAERAIEALKKMLSPMITVIREGIEKEIYSKDLVPGDILILEAGDRIPADARLVEVRSIKCDEASLTGESVPVGKDVKPLHGDVPVCDRLNMVFTGTSVAYGRGKAVVTATGMNTEFGRIAEQVAASKPKKTPLEKRTQEIGKWLSVTALSICFIVAGVGLIREALAVRIGMEFIISTVMFAVALAVAAVPEALPAIVTGALAIGMRQMARHNALIRKMPAVETLGCTTVICSDKTGTLTKGEMTIRKIFCGGRWVEVTGAGYEPEGEFRIGDEAVSEESKPLRMLLLGGLLCNDASLARGEDKWLIKGDPTEGALIVAATKAGLNQGEINYRNPRVGEIPFSSERKRMTTIHEGEDNRTRVFMKGAPEVVLRRCAAVFDEGGIREIREEDRLHILRANEEMAQEALRVLAVATREMNEDTPDLNEEVVERDMTFLGLVGMIDPPRREAVEAVGICQGVNIRTIMITGDQSHTAVAVAREIGIYKEGDLALTGEELDKMPEEQFEEIVDKVSVYSRVSPIDKLKIVKAWKKRGDVVAMTGDGVNDAPALKHADIGIAMGITGTEVTKDASDMVLSDDNFATIVKAIELGRWIYDNIKKYLTYLLRCNLTEVAVIGGAAMILGPEYLPLLPAAILYINLATDGLPALALGVAPSDPDIMMRPPRNPKEGIFSKEVRAFVLMALLIEIPFFYLLFFHELTDLAHARTEIFFLFIIIELIIALNFRSLRFSIFRAPPHKWLILSIIWEVLLITVLVQVPAVRESFGILKPSFSTLAIIFGFGVFIFFTLEVLKMFLRGRFRLRKNPHSS